MMLTEWTQKFLQAFIPLFVAMDVIGVLPIFISMTNGLTDTARNKLITEATLTAGGLSILFLFGGKLVFTFLGISENDFRVAGGLVLLTFAIRDLLFSPSGQRRKPSVAGAVPIGVPLIMGPAALTTILILVDSAGYALTLIGLLLNLGVVWIVFRKSYYLYRILGEEGSNAGAKVAALFIAAIAVMMIRVGIHGFLTAPPF